MRDFYLKHKFNIKIVIGIILISIGFIIENYWFYLGIIPLLVGITKFCPACYFLKKCSIKLKDK